LADPLVRNYIDRLLTPGPVGAVETTAYGFGAGELDQAAGLSYWEQRTWRELGGTLNTDRLNNNPEERDAVFAAMWQVKPGSPIAAASEATVTIPPNAARKTGLMYRFSFRPASDPKKMGDVDSASRNARYLPSGDHAGS